jgi:hypothetical protein
MMPYIFIYTLVGGGKVLKYLKSRRDDDVCSPRFERLNSALFSAGREGRYWGLVLTVFPWTAFR